MTAFLLALHGCFASIAAVLSIMGLRAKSGERVRALATWLAVAVVAQTSVGGLLYPRYLRTAKPALKALSAGMRSAADVFEVKEHLAFVVLVCALGAFAVTRDEPKPTAFVRLLFGCAHGGILLVATLGLVVFSLKTP